MPAASDPGLNLFLGILLKLEELEIPYVIIGGFAATICISIMNEAEEILARGYDD